MNFYVMTLFPEMIMQGISTSITGRAMQKGAIHVEAVNIRDYTREKHGHCDDYPYGGGAGMVMQAQPICDCYAAVLERIRARQEARRSETAESLTDEMRENAQSIASEAPNSEMPENKNAAGTAVEADAGAKKKPRVIYLTPQGKVFHQKMAEDFAKEEDLIFLCGHYEGVDERALEILETENVSIGDYVLTGGELPAMIMIDCISRLVPGVLGKDESALIESFHDNLLEYPQYTRPEVYEGRTVPEILLSGHHANVEKWRREKSIERTLAVRPELLENAALSKKERAYLEKLLRDIKETDSET